MFDGECVGVLDMCCFEGVVVEGGGFVEDADEFEC